MPGMDGKGPEGRGSATGRGLGNCKNNSEKKSGVRIGQGLGLRRKAGGGQGGGKRKQYGNNGGA
ncbi:DUF5320 domain-containing protein [Geofilum sp. OHC36d9]|uniref:DUF5320 domain-containing protein n=1 Tax=Geofilum sp. OHC36d9 TaxID=3458413 RepID=UPI004034F2EA